MKPGILEEIQNKCRLKRIISEKINSPEHVASYLASPKENLSLCDVTNEKDLFVVSNRILYKFFYTSFVQGMIYSFIEKEGLVSQEEEILLGLDSSGILDFLRSPDMFIQRGDLDSLSFKINQYLGNYKKYNELFGNLVNSDC